MALLLIIPAWIMLLVLVTGLCSAARRGDEETPAHARAQRQAYLPGGRPAPSAEEHGARTPQVAASSDGAAASRRRVEIAA
ncbi:MAG: hypothetical protein ACLQBB_08620 [Solirubrobacteraceae bacterium]